jgi:hypothetical protein
MAEVGKKEMAQVGAPPKDQKGKPVPNPEPVSQLREDIGHLEKAAQNFAQAEALAPGENEAQALQEKAAEQLNELRNQLDQAQAQAGLNPPAPGEGEAPPGAEPSEKPGEQPAKGMNPPMKPMLSFSDIRGSTELEGQFKELGGKKKIRDW